jgi:hypothetical protein
MSAVVICSLYPFKKSNNNESKPMTALSNTKNSDRRKHRKNVATIFIVLIVVSVVLTASEYPKDLNFTVRDMGGPYPLPSTVRAVGKYIAQHTTENEEIISWPIYSFEAQRKQVCNIVYWSSYHPGERETVSPPELLGYPSIENLTKYINDTKPKYFVLDYNFWWYVLSGQPYLKDYLLGNTDKNIKPRYVFETEIDGVKIYVYNG